MRKFARRWIAESIQAVGESFGNLVCVCQALAEWADPGEWYRRGE